MTVPPETNQASPSSIPLFLQSFSPRRDSADNCPPAEKRHQSAALLCNLGCSTTIGAPAKPREHEPKGGPASGSGNRPTVDDGKRRKERNPIMMNPSCPGGRRCRGRQSVINHRHIQRLQIVLVFWGPLSGGAHLGGPHASCERLVYLIQKS
ncbi:hypothetical protein VUR80DRAFT_6356 [Thermomyces stellatus]